MTGRSSWSNYLASRFDELEEFERVGEVETALCCARFLPAWARAKSPEGQDEVQRALQQRVERSGGAWLATTVLRGRRALRINVNSFLTERRHIDYLVELLRHEGTKLTQGGKDCMKSKAARAALPCLVCLLLALSPVAARAQAPRKAATKPAAEDVGALARTA